MLYPNTMQQFSAIHMLSPEGISHSFDDRANGYGRGEGIGCLVIKRLSDALRDGDTIRAVIRNTGTNADGKTPSITAPSSDAQIDLINRTYAGAGLDLRSTEYFECHGTGTPVGVCIWDVLILKCKWMLRFPTGPHRVYGSRVNNRQSPQRGWPLSIVYRQRKGQCGTYRRLCRHGWSLQSHSLPREGNACADF